jgi:hypothetical protein
MLNSRQAEVGVQENRRILLFSVVLPILIVRCILAFVLTILRTPMSNAEPETKQLRIDRVPAGEVPRVQSGPQLPTSRRLAIFPSRDPNRFPPIIVVAKNSTREAPLVACDPSSLSLHKFYD